MVYYHPDAEIIRMYATKIIDEYAEKYSSAITCFPEEFGTCIQHMAFPAGHQKHIMTTHLLERTFGEQKRRTKIIPRFFDEKSYLKLVYATIVRVSQKWRWVKISTFDLTFLQNIRKLYNWEERENWFVSKKALA